MEETLDTGATFSTVTEMQAEVGKAQQTYEEIENLEDSHIVSFPKLDKEKEALRRKTQGERVPFETEDLITSLTNITEPPQWLSLIPQTLMKSLKKEMNI